MAKARVVLTFSEEDPDFARLCGAADAWGMSATTLAAHGSAQSPNSVVIEAVEEPPETARPEDEVPDELGPAKPPKPRGNSCAGCSGTSGGGAVWFVVISIALLAARRRTILSA